MGTTRDHFEVPENCWGGFEGGAWKFGDGLLRDAVVTHCGCLMKDMMGVEGVVVGVRKG